MSNSIEKKDYYNFLYSYYQNLLTKKQQEIFESYYFEDFSLQEIANELEVSRNAIWDLLKKVQHNLEDYESKLHLYQNDCLFNKLLNELENHVDDYGKKIIEQIKEME